MDNQIANNIVASRPIEKRKKSYPGKKAGHYDGKWFNYYTRKWNRPTLMFKIGPASYFDNRAHIQMALGWITLYINLPIYSTWDECEYPEYGSYYHSDALVLCWNMKKKFLHMPWDMEWVRTSNLRKDGTWEHEVNGDRKSFYDDKWKEIIWHETYPYTYTLNNGTVQKRTATIKVEEIECRPRWFMWTSIFKSVSKSITVEFSDEVGERTGSWKGGTVGCGYNMKYGELPEQTLRRMEKERKFN